MSTDPAPYVTAPRLSAATLAALTEALATVQRDITALRALLGDADTPVARTVRMEISRAGQDAARARELAGLAFGEGDPARQLRGEARRMLARAEQHAAAADGMLRELGAEE